MIKFKSRKNEVVLLDGGLVRKTFASASACDNEYRTLQLLQSGFAPKLLSRPEPNVILTQYIKGDLLLDRFINASIKEAVSLAVMLSETMLFVHKETGGCIPYDENFRNYIVTERAIFRIDYEETAKGSLVQWGAKLLAFAALYQVPQEVKSAFSQTLIQRLSLDKAELAAQYAKELVLLCERRGIDCPKTFFL